MIFDTTVATEEERAKFALLTVRLKRGRFDNDNKKIGVFLGETVRHKIMRGLQDKYRPFTDDGNHFDGSKQQEKHAGLIFVKAIAELNDVFDTVFDGKVDAETCSDELLDTLLDNILAKLQAVYVLPDFQNAVTEAQAAETEHRLGMENKPTGAPHAPYWTTDAYTQNA